MNRLIRILCFGLIAVEFVSALPTNEDTYLQAFQNSHGPSDLYGPPPGYNYEPQIQQPQQEYGPPQPVYGPPQPEYGPPQPEYGPPPHTEYGPPPQTEYVNHPTVIYHEYPKPQSIPYNHHQVSLPEWLLGKLKLKLNLFTLGKILLKLIIFKKIVKFIGIICLLLFLPKLGGLFKMEEPADNADASVEMRDFHTDRDYFNERLEESARQVLKSLEEFTKRYGSESSSS